MASLATIRKECEDIIAELHQLTDILEQNLNRPDLAKRIDTFFYVEANHQLMRIYNQLDYGWEADANLTHKLKGIQSLVRSQWQRDYRFIACPATLHRYLE